jgi:hypothetical protein|nr:MAG: hypothetical protein [Bacteriophage sp.]
MAIDFKTFDQAQMKSLSDFADAIDADADMHDVTEYRGGFLPTKIYQSALRRDSLKDIHTVSSTHTGALMMRNATLLATASIAAAKQDGSLTPEYERTVQAAAVMVVKFMAEEDLNETYHDWFMQCANVPSTATSTLLGLLFTAEVLNTIGSLLGGGLGGRNVTVH